MAQTCYACGKEIPPASDGQKVEFSGEKIIICYKCFKESKAYDNLETFVAKKRELKDLSPEDKARLARVS